MHLPISAYALGLNTLHISKFHWLQLDLCVNVFRIFLLEYFCCHLELYAVIHPSLRCITLSYPSSFSFTCSISVCVVLPLQFLWICLGVQLCLVHGWVMRIYLYCSLVCIYSHISTLKSMRFKICIIIQWIEAAYCAWQFRHNFCTVSTNCMAFAHLL